MVLGDVLGDEAIFGDLTFALARPLPAFTEKFGRVDLVPRAFANATDQAVARSIIQQWEVISRRDRRRVAV
eukprot:4343978-Pyramimonas_sp.AAC.1